MNRGVKFRFAYILIHILNSQFNFLFLPFPWLLYFDIFLSSAILELISINSFGGGAAGRYRERSKRKIVKQ